MQTLKHKLLRDQLTEETFRLETAVLRQSVILQNNYASKKK